MRLFYHNFDTLDVAFQCAFPKELRAQLAEAKREAVQNGQATYIALGKGKLPVSVFETGASGGYQYRFDTGLDGMVWLVKERDVTTEWNVFVSVKSMALAMHGYEGMKAKIYQYLEDFGAIAPNTINRVTGRPFDKPLESVNRVDYCFDFIADSFLIDPEAFVLKYAKKKKVNGKFDVNFEVNGTGKLIESVTIGKMPNRQVILYDKTREVRAKYIEKDYWWQVWGYDKERFNETIIRIEVRSGKDDLKDRYNVSTFAELEKSFERIFSQNLNTYRYTIPNFSDSNRSRWKNAAFWGEAILAVKSGFSRYSSGKLDDVSDSVLRQMRMEKLGMFENNIKGCFVSYLALLDLPLKELPEAVNYIADIFDKALKSPSEAEILADKYDKAKKKVSFLYGQA
jgi:hypothetical protein